LILICFPYTKGTACKYVCMHVCMVYVCECACLLYVRNMALLHVCVCVCVCSYVHVFYVAHVCVCVCVCVGRLQCVFVYVFAVYESYKRFLHLLINAVTVSVQALETTSIQFMHIFERPFCISKGPFCLFRNAFLHFKLEGSFVLKQRPFCLLKGPS
jgi:hypothetical protein